MPSKLDKNCNNGIPQQAAATAVAARQTRHPEVEKWDYSTWHTGTQRQTEFPFCHSTALGMYFFDQDGNLLLCFQIFGWVWTLSFDIFVSIFREKGQLTGQIKSDKCFSFSFYLFFIHFFCISFESCLSFDREKCVHDFNDDNHSRNVWHLILNMDQNGMPSGFVKFRLEQIVLNNRLVNIELVFAASIPIQNILKYFIVFILESVLAVDVLLLGFHHRIWFICCSLFNDLCFNNPRLCY